MTSLPGDIEMEMEDRERSLREAKKKPLELRAPEDRLAIKICRFANGHEACFCHNENKLYACSLSAKFAGEVRDFCAEQFHLSPAQRSSIPNHPEGGK